MMLTDTCGDETCLEFFEVLSQLSTSQMTSELRTGNSEACKDELDRSRSLCSTKIEQYNANTRAEEATLKTPVSAQHI